MLVVKGELPDEPCLSTSEVFQRVKYQQLQGTELLSCSSAKEGITYTLSNLKHSFVILSPKVAPWIHLKNVSQKTDCFSRLPFLFRCH